MSGDTRAIDFDAHNTEVSVVMESYEAGRPTRVPLRFGINPRYTMFDHPANPRNITFEQYSIIPDLMIERQIEHQAWVRTHIPQDSAMGMPEDGWEVYVDFQNYYEAAWYGAEVHYYDGQVPDTRPMLSDERTKWSIIERGAPDPFSHAGAARWSDVHEHMLRRMEEGREYMGLPITTVAPPMMGTDGPVTVACNLRGAAEFMMDLIDDSEYAHALLTFITDTNIDRLKSYRERYNQEQRPESGMIADDSILLLSTSMYESEILPYHRKLYDELFGAGPHGIHLCGDATRHFPLIMDRLNVRTFDTGYPVDFSRLRETLGPDVEIMGGPSVPFLENASPEQVRRECRRILESGIMEGGRFILREGNNLAPGIDQDNLWAMWDAVHDFGTY